MAAEDFDSVLKPRSLSEVSSEFAGLGCGGGWGGDALELAAGPCRRKAGEEDRGTGAAEGLVWACCGMQGWRPTMEDAALMLPFGYLGGAWRDSALFGVFDGHGGEQVARFAARTLPTALAESPSSDPEEAFSGAYRRIDDLLRAPSASSSLRELTLPGNPVVDNADRCGTTATCCLLRGQEIVVANAGDSRIVLCRRGEAVDLSTDHKPELPVEEARIDKAGGYIEEEVTPRGSLYRVNGELALSRALGDFHYKDVKLKQHEQMVSCVPETRRVTWQAGVDEFLLIACDGVWETMDSQEAVNLVRRCLPPPGSKKKLLPVLEALLDACCASHPQQRGGLGCDNLTAVLVRFEDPAAVAAAKAANEAEEAEGRDEDGPRRRQLEAALGETIQRLSERKFETQLDRDERQAREQADRAERELREREEEVQWERRMKRRLEREAQEKTVKKKPMSCAALEDDEEEDFDAM